MIKVKVKIRLEKEREVKAYKTKTPKMTSHRGRTWDIIGRTDKDEKIYADTTWGFCGYFLRDGQCYKFSLFEGGF